MSEIDLMARVMAEFPLLDDAGLSEEHCCEWMLQQERKRLHALLTGKDVTAYPISHDYERGGDDE